MRTAIAVLFLSVSSVFAGPPTPIVHPPRPPLVAETSVGSCRLAWSKDGYWSGTVHATAGDLNLKVIPGGAGLPAVKWGTNGTANRNPFNVTGKPSPLMLHFEIQSTNAAGFWGRGSATSITGTIRE